LNEGLPGGPIMQEPLFTKIEFWDYDLFIPFVCGQCGTCCRTYTPFLTVDQLVEIARDIKWPEQELLDTYDRCFRMNLAGKQIPCLFLLGTRCAIYRHPLRPDVCRLYPFSFGKPDIRNCPGYDEHCKLISHCISGEKDFEYYDSSFCPERGAPPPPETKWPLLRLALARSDPSRLVVRYFLKMNRLPLSFLQQRTEKHRPHAAALHATP
jgi:Fe-S-cluster containining protein